MLALLLLLTCIAVPSLGYPSPCVRPDDTMLSQLEYQACIKRHIRLLKLPYDPTGRAYHNVRLQEDEDGDDLDLDPNYDDDDDVTGDELDAGDVTGIKFGKRNGRGMGSGRWNQQWVRKLVRLLRKFQHQSSSLADQKRNTEEELSDDELLRIVSDYYQWRKRNGRPGNSSGRWGRDLRHQTRGTNAGSVAYVKQALLRSGLVNGMGRQRLARLLQMLRSGKMPLTKGDEFSKRGDDKVLQEYKQWRGENGYGQAAGRWG